MLDKMLKLLVTGNLNPFVFKQPSEDTQTVVPPGLHGLYIHMPFCRQLCSFCPYCRTLYEPGLAATYQEALLQEGRRLASTPGLRLESVYVGGGTPSTLLGGLEELLNILGSALEPGASVGVELHPLDCQGDAAERLMRAGVNMVSLGAQSFQDEILSSLGRQYSGKLATESLRSLVDMGFRTVNVDLMTLLPGQTAGQIMDDCRRATSLRAHQLSMYPLFVFPHSDFQAGHAPRPGLGEQARILSSIMGLVRHRGYGRTSLWTFTLQGHPSYSSITRASFTGIGAGAAGFTASNFSLNTFDVPSYCKAVLAGRSPVALSAELDCRQVTAYRLFWQAYTGRISAAGARSSGLALKSALYLSQVIGLVRWADPDYLLTLRGYQVYQFLESYYTRKYMMPLWAACHATPYPPGLVL